MHRPRLLILSFSRIFRDARVLKQVNLFKDEFRVTTCGYGSAPCEGVEHIEIPADQGVWNLNGRLITLKQYSQVYWRLDGPAWVWKTLRGRRFDAVIANDYDTVPIGVRLNPTAGVHADLHEYAPAQGEHDEAWRRRIKPWREWVLRKYASRASSWTTVCQGIADKYNDAFGFQPQVVTNAAPHADLKPTPPHHPLKLVYHGNANRDRGIDWMMRAVSAAKGDFTFDLYLPKSSSEWMDVLRGIADSDPRVTIRDAVPYDELMSTLNNYDVGVYVLRPKNFNQLHALPNKIFDYVQARCGIVTGPNPEMSRVVQENDLGVVVPDFEAESLTCAIEAITADRVRTWKANADLAAWDLSSDVQNVGWERPIRELLGGTHQPPA